MSSHPAPRRFIPEPVETTSSSKKPRRFAPEPVESSLRTSKDSKAQEEASENTETRGRRRFAPQPIENSTTSSKSNSSKCVPPVKPANTRRGQFNLLPHEMLWLNNDDDEEDTDSEFDSEASTSTTASGSKPARKFAPQLLETATRSRKAGDEVPTISSADKTEAISGFAAQSKRTDINHNPTAPEDAPHHATLLPPETLEARRTGSPLARVRSNSLRSNRSHSFRIPNLDPIESSESEEELEDPDPPSLSSTPSESSDKSAHYKHATRLRESVDDRTSGYLLQLAAKSAEKQLRDQAMAAFPNNDIHEPVDHYIGRDSDDTSMSMSRSVDGVTEIDWEMIAMRQHREKAQEEKEKEELNRKADKAMGISKSNNGLWSGPFGKTGMAKGNKPWKCEIGLKQMQEGARPPMLGGEIEFPRCPSPEPARFDVTQGSDIVRQNMCYLTQQTQVEPCDEEGLWHGPKDDEHKPNQRPSLWSTKGSSTPPGGGLWGGFCKEGMHGMTPPRGPTGLMTPAVEGENPFESHNIDAVTQSQNQTHLLPPSPPPSNSGISSLDEKLELERSLEEEFDDSFVTQVYNYLSLGYPSMARQFDDELSKISKVEIKELRQDDQLSTARGYIRLGDEENGKEMGISEQHCARWKALRLYVREWGRQQPRMAPAPSHQAGFGVTVRRGSWACLITLDSSSDGSAFVSNLGTNQSIIYIGKCLGHMKSSSTLCVLAMTRSRVRLDMMEPFRPESNVIYRNWEHFISDAYLFSGVPSTPASMHSGVIISASFYKSHNEVGR
ncbi:hypothetical protein K402DRAFT_401725 [Aulographum hederae CBS 113979]|uniref:Uncharacterized protein n=1 Tax=Aulographum hederae CBS 113979 TaxID=1176131 RepID=A0A6G1H8S7_9PEZI|nr:hypothetical protein K402DRAFT_401725 [Aulographum hederae CBS 113979]